MDSATQEQLEKVQQPSSMETEESFDPNQENKMKEEEEEEMEVDVSLVRWYLKLLFLLLLLTLVTLLDTAIIQLFYLVIVFIIIIIVFLGGARTSAKVCQEPIEEERKAEAD